MPSLTIPFRPLAARASALCPPSSSLALRGPLRAGQQTQTRHASILGALSDNPGAYNKRIRRGRGPASGKGKTSGRGHKGQKQHGKVPAHFNGGQTPDEVVKGKRGFTNPFALEFARVNLDRIQQWIDQGRLDTSKPITVKELQESRCLHGVKDGVKILARNAADLRTPIHITVSRASAAAVAAIEAAGGTIQTRFYTRQAIQRILRNSTHPTLSRMSAPPALPQSTSDATVIPPSAAETPESQRRVEEAVESTVDAGIMSSALRAYPPPEAFPFRLPDPTRRRDFEYYRDAAHRGYLAYQVEEGAGPSLFFKTPKQMAGAAENAKRKRKGKAGAGAKSENRLF